MTAPIGPMDALLLPRGVFRSRSCVGLYPCPRLCACAGLCRTMCVGAVQGSVASVSVSAPAAAPPREGSNQAGGAPTDAFRPMAQFAFDDGFDGMALQSDELFNVRVVLGVGSRVCPGTP